MDQNELTAAWLVVMRELWLVRQLGMPDDEVTLLQPDENGQEQVVSMHIMGLGIRRSQRNFRRTPDDPEYEETRRQIISWQALELTGLERFGQLSEARRQQIEELAEWAKKQVAARKARAQQQQLAEQEQKEAAAAATHYLERVAQGMVQVRLPKDGEPNADQIVEVPMADFLQVIAKGLGVPELQARIYNAEIETMRFG